ncbi:GGDEF domain-containing protein [Oceanospirillum sediminis]|uniref:GGDEF domain-containing protein n=1 Tax=Oceanospirillum sediminis TaxID=2760088 RepID=A0A839IM21_9GAMM|nr:GGDEF domain-containing protein [Oceanospirillum sediminis]MBB1485517.1 GGDEF domain-containing protein [Oceanospirillum sediminis]
MDIRQKAHLHAAYFILAGAGTLLLSWGYYGKNLSEAGSILLAGGVALVLCGCWNLWSVRHYNGILPFLVLLIFGGLSIAGHWIPSMMTAHWAYILPLYLFSLLNFKPALLLTLAYASIFNLSTTVQLEGVERLQVLYLFWSATTIACIFIFTNRERQQHLQKLISIDPESGAYNLQQLHDDLVRELARNDRENTSLAILCFKERQEQPRKDLKKLSDHITPQLRPFDRLYRHQDHLVAILPSANYQDSIHLCARFHKAREIHIALAAIIPGEHDTEKEVLIKAEAAIMSATEQAADAPLYLVSDFLDTTEGFHA